MTKEPSANILGLFHKKSILRNTIISNVLLIICVSFTLIRFWFAVQTPLVPHMNSLFDDQVFVAYAKSILEKNWLGAYSHLTLRKYFGYSLFMCLCFVLGTPYQMLIMVFLCVSIIVFLVAIKPMIPSLNIRCVLYLVLIFSAESFTYRFMQATYRLGVVVPCVFLVFSGYIALFLRRDESVKKLIPWSVISTIGLAFFWFIMESSVWIMPFVIVCSLISAGYWLARYMRKRNSLKVLVGKLMLIVIPLMGVGASWMLFAALNYHYYGVFLVNDYMEGSFSDFASEAIKVDAGDSEDGVWITRADLDDIIENSPTLQTIEPELRAAWDGWAGGGSPAQIRGDICWWAFRTGYSDAGGFTDARETQHFWANAADELEHAFSDGKLKEKNGFYLSKSTQPVTGGSVIPWLKHTAFFMFKLSSSDTILDNVGINSPYQYGSNPDNSDFDWLRFVETISPGRVAGEEGDVAAEKSKVFLELNSFVASVAYCLWCILGVLCLPCCIMLIWRLIKKNEVQGLITFLLVAVSMLLSALAVVMVNAWFTEFFWVDGTLDSVTESMAGYAIGYYPLIEMMICTIIGLSCQKFFVEKVCFESRRN